MTAISEMEQPRIVRSGKLHAGRRVPIIQRWFAMHDQPADDVKLAWDDLIVDHITPDETAAWLAEWQWLGLGRIAPIFLSRFGNWFFRRPDGSVHMLEIAEGSVDQMAPDFGEFQAAVNRQDWQEQYLYSALVLRYRRRGIVASGRQVIGFAPHPAFVDSLDKCTPMLFDMIVWQSICGQTLRQARG